MAYPDTNGVKVTKGDILFSLALAFAVWFALTGIIWTYNAALFIAYPAGIISLILWGKGRRLDNKKRRYRFVPILLIVGMILSLAVLCYLLIFD